MYEWERTKYVVVRDFEYDMFIAMDTVKVTYQKGDRLSLREHGRMARDLLKMQSIQKIEE